MLILSRKAVEGQDEIRIGDDIVIKVLKSSDGKARIGVSAPKGVAVVRGELTEFPPVPCSSKEEKAWERFVAKARNT